MSGGGTNRHGWLIAAAINVHVFNVVCVLSTAFWGASAFNQPIGKWKVDQVTTLLNSTWATLLQLLCMAGSA